MAESRWCRCRHCRCTVMFLDPEIATPPPPTPPPAASTDEQYISITVNCLVSFRAMWTSSPPDIPQVRTQKTLLVPLREFAADALSGVRRVLADTGLVFMDACAEYVAALARDALPAAAARHPRARVLPLLVALSTERMVRSAAQLESLMVAYATRLSARAAIRTVPAAESAVKALEFAVRESGDHGQCSICLEEFDDHDGRDRRAVRMPCSHIYHRDCIARWLGKDHRCPLCRYRMPTESGFIN